MYTGGKALWDKGGPYTPVGYVLPHEWLSPRTRVTYQFLGREQPHHLSFRTILEIDNQLSTSLVGVGSHTLPIPRFLAERGLRLTMRWANHPWYSCNTVAEGWCPVVLLQAPEITGSPSPRDLAALMQGLETTVAYVATYDLRLARESVDSILRPIHSDYTWGTSVGGRVRFVNQAWSAVGARTPLLTKLNGKKICKLAALPSCTRYSTICSALAKAIPSELEEKTRNGILEFLSHIAGYTKDDAWLPVLVQALLTNQPDPARHRKASRYYAERDAALAEALGVGGGPGVKGANGATLNTIAHHLDALGFTRAAAEMSNTRAWRGWRLLARLAGVWLEHPTFTAKQLAYVALCTWAGVLAGADAHYEPTRASRALERRASQLPHTDIPSLGGAGTDVPSKMHRCFWYLATKLTRYPSTHSFRLYDKNPAGIVAAAQLWAAALRQVIACGLDERGEAVRGLQTLSDVVEQSHIQACAKVVAGTSRKHLKCLNLLFPPTGWTDDRHVTCRLSDVVWTYLHPTSQCDPEETSIMRQIARASPPTLPQRLKQLNNILGTIPVGTNNVLATSYVLSSLGVEPDSPFRAHLARRGYLFTHVEAQAARLKAISACARRTATVLSGDALLDSEAAKLAAYDMMFGRAANTTDWDEEIHNRCSMTIPLGLRPLGGLSISAYPPVVSEREALLPPTPANREDFQRRLEAKIATVIDKLADKRSATSTLLEFWNRRGEWMTSGSSAGAKLELPGDLPATAKARLGEHITLSKRGWAEATSFETILKAFNSPTPMEVATASEKMENGKSRAIYGVTPEHYVINTFATAGLEERLHLQEGFEKGAEGIAAFATDMHRAHLTARPDLEMTMLDYADFNRHHSPEHQAAVFRALADWGRRNGASRDWVKANEWVAASKARMRCRFPDRRVLDVKQGMFSGTRSTDLINTILNLCYFQVASDLVSETYGLQAVGLYHVHQGDDVWLSNRSSAWARYLYATLAALGLLFQPQKQMFGPGRGEYLRVLYSHGRGYGYMARALANFQLRPVQNDVALDPAAWAASIHDGVSTLLRRGVSHVAASCLWRATMPFWTRIQAHPKDARPIRFPGSVRTAPRYLGGLSCGFPLGHDFATRPLQPFPKYRRQAPPWVGSLPSKMTNDWVAQLATKLHPSARVIDVNRVKASILATSYEDILRVADHHASNANYKRQVAQWMRHAPAPVVDHVGGVSVYDPTPVPVLGVGKHSPALHLLTQEAGALGTSCPQVETLVGLGHVLSGVRGVRSQARAGESGYKGAVAKWLASTPFKSLDLAMSAYGMKSREVLAMLMSQYSHSAARAVSGLTVLAPILRSNSDALVDLILGGGLGVASSLAWTVHKSFLSYCTTEAVDQVLNIHCTSKVNNTDPLARQCVRSMGALLVAGLKVDQLSLNRVLY